MTDLRNGIIELEEMTITPDTTKEDLMRVYGEQLNKSMSTATFFDFNRLFHIENNEFMIMFSFENAGKIKSIQLWPTVQYKSEKWDRTGMQEERRQFCDKWLYDRLGEPHKVLNGDIEYSYNTHSISCFSNFDVRDGANAGYIVVAYNQLILV